MTPHWLALSSAPPVLCCYLRKLVCACVCVASRPGREDKGRDGARTWPSSGRRQSRAQAKDARRGFDPVIAPAFHKTVDRFQNAHRRIFHNVRQSSCLRNIGAPPPTSNAPSCKCPSTSLSVCCARRGSQVDPRAAGSAQAPRLQTRCLRQRDIDESHVGRQCFFLAVYEALLTEVWDQPLL